MDGSTRAQQLFRLVITVLVVGALWLPVVRNHDSFPLSTQPMYATARDRIETLASAVGITHSGHQKRLSLRLIADTDDPLVAESLLENAIKSGQADELCDEIVSRIDSDDLETIEVVSETLDLIDWVRSEAPPLDRMVHATCDVEPRS